ncbi:hypothetical protein LPJ78_002828 [Coemansia sp. RSA 989]|nr:hypothetical protein BX667DRAFT_502774 [Coemansia mojavensis]KAJ1742110.1 hypothetical protein LPJ68_002218 [Coemansia sp. RSA 1086]KAJ1865254.1 hypothetical protein LPJ78_002828 [Coemansia sp. RSA 989]KAJ1872634.1 hypothetical protein LPJ55_002934 [Coemansia sp. RSA 990]KAJ2675573.1 hypothetical protein IWW42_000995 [Coemansia sp. RSA 1085]
MFRFLVLIATAAMAVLGAPQSRITRPAVGKCPSPADCYQDFVMPKCPEGELCAQVMKEVVACKWQCGDTIVPYGCKQRCKPCHAQVCTDICECEIECSADGPCTAAQTAASSPTPTN